MPAAEALIRSATADDLQSINAIYNREIETGTATWDYEPWSLADRVRWFEAHDADEPVLVAEVDGQLAGFAYLSSFRPKFGYRFTREDTVYLDPAFQGRGLGRRLLKALIEQARQRGIRTVLAVIEAENEASIALHERLGFVRCAHHHEVGYKFGRWLDSVDLELRLPDGGPEP